MSEDINSIIEAQKEADRIERERIKELKKLELAELLKKQMDEDSKISEDEIRAYDEFMKKLSEEDITEAFSRQKPELDDVTVDTDGRELSYERSVIRKPPNASLDLTREHIEEMNYCFKHPIYMIKNYIKIINQDKGIMNFKMYPFQAKFIKDCFANKRVIGNWCRQVGKCETSTTSITYIKIPTSFFKRIVLYIIMKLYPKLIKIKIIG
jgi:histone H3/H4